MLTWLPTDNTMVYADLDIQPRVPFRLTTHGWYTERVSPEVITAISKREPFTKLILGTDNNFLYHIPSPIPNATFPGLAGFAIPTYESIFMDFLHFARVRRDSDEIRKDDFLENTKIESLSIGLPLGVEIFRSSRPEGLSPGPCPDSISCLGHVAAEAKTDHAKANVVLYHTWSKAVASTTYRQYLRITADYTDATSVTAISDHVYTLQGLLTLLLRSPVSVDNVHAHTTSGIGFEYCHSLWYSPTDEVNQSGQLPLPLPAGTLLHIWLATHSDRRLCEVLEYFVRAFDLRPAHPHEATGLFVQALEALAVITIGKQLNRHITRKWAAEASSPFPPEAPGKLTDWRNNYFAHRQNLYQGRDVQTEASYIEVFAYWLASTVLLRHLGLTDTNPIRFTRFTRGGTDHFYI